MKKTILAAASHYNMKYYLNPRFSSLPRDIKTDIRVICVTGAARTKGIFILGFYNDGSVYCETQRAADDFFYDEIEAKLCLSALEKDNAALFDALSTYAQTFLQP